MYKTYISYVYINLHIFFTGFSAPEEVIHKETCSAALLANVIAITWILEVRMYCFAGKKVYTVDIYIYLLLYVSANLNCFSKLLNDFTVLERLFPFIHSSMAIDVAGLELRRDSPRSIEGHTISHRWL